MRIVRNLVENALAYGQQRGRGRGPPWPATRRGARSATTARGSPPPTGERVFERFSRLEKSRSREFDGGEHHGFGLGLAISSELASGQGGTISVADSDLGGALFTLSLPSAADGE